MANVTVIQPTISVGQDEKIRCAAYCRVSSSSDDQLNSFAVQMSYYNQKFEHSDTEMLVDIYADEGISGTGMTKREEFNRMLADCRRGKIDRIYTKSISRFARNTRDCLTVVRELKSLGITIKFEKECLDTAQMTDEIMLTVMGSLAQEESVSISQNMQWSVQKRFANGTYLISTPPFGYRYREQELIIYEPEAETVRKIFSMYLSGAGIHAISEQLLRSDNQRLFSKSGIRYILTNPVYIGWMLMGKTICADTFPYKHQKNHGEKQQYVIEQHHQAVISEEEYQRVQELLAEHDAHAQKTESPFDQKIICSRCLKPFRKKRQGEKMVWVCPVHDRNKHACPCKSISQTAIENTFIRLCNKLHSHYRDVLSPLLHCMQNLMIQQYSGNQTSIALHQEIAKLLEQTHVIARLHTKGFLDHQKYLAQSTELEAKIARLRTKQKKLYQADASDDMMNQIEILISHFAKQEKIMTEFDADLFAMMIENITVTPDHELCFHLIGGLQFNEICTAL